MVATSPPPRRTLAPDDPRRPTTATWVRRLVAAIIDFFLAGLLVQALVPLYSPIWIYVPNAGNLHGQISFTFLKKFSDLSAWPWGVVAIVLYYILFEGAFAASPGKALLGLRVVSATAERPSFAAIVIRNLFRPIEAIPPTLFIGIIAAAVSPYRQRLGDRAARTLVVEARGVPWTALPASAARRRGGIVAGAIVLAYLAGIAFSYVNPWPIIVERGTSSGVSAVAVTSPTIEIPGVLSMISTHSLGTHRNGTHLTYSLRYILTAPHRRYTCKMNLSMHWTGPGLINAGWTWDGFDNACMGHKTHIPLG